MDVIHPDLNRKVQQNQERQTRDHDTKAKGHWFTLGDSVLTRNFSLGPKWIPGTIESVTGPVSYKVMLRDGRVVRRHVDQILAHKQIPEKGTERQQTDTTQQGQTVAEEETLLDVEDVVLSGDKLEEPAAEAADKSETNRGTVSRSSPVKRQSKRVTKIPCYLKDFQLN